MFEVLMPFERVRWEADNKIQFNEDGMKWNKKPLNIHGEQL